MADPLLMLAANPEFTQGASRLGMNPDIKQSVGGEPHPFAQLLAKHGFDAEALPGGLATPWAVLLAGKAEGQGLAGDGKDLPDPARLLARAGFDFLDETGPTPVDAVAMEAGQAAWWPDDSGAPLVVAEAAHPLASPLARPDAGQAGGAADPLARLAVAQARMEGDAGLSRAPGQGPGQPSGTALPGGITPAAGEADLPSLPEPARLVGTVLQETLQASAGQGKSPRLGELIRAAATGAADPAPRVETTPVIGAQSATAASAQPLATALPVTHVAVPLGQPGWDQALGGQVQWMVGKRLQGAEIRLNPAHLGPMEVRIQVQNDQATIQFTAQQGLAREALEAAIPRLREMLGDAGVQLNTVTVSDQSLAEQRRQQAQASPGGQAGPTGDTAADDEPDVVAVTPLREGAGAIDLFA